MIKKCFSLLAFVMSMNIFVSCVPKNVIYFQDRNIGTFEAGKNSKEMTLLPNDRISVYVKSRNQELSTIFNISGNGSSATANNAGSGSVLDYTIDPDGNINIPVLGKISVVGLNRVGVASAIQDTLRNSGLVDDAVVTVMYNNLYVNVLGEMGATRQLIQQDKYTILDLIADCGDLNFNSAKRKNIMVMRDENGVKKAYKIDLTSIQDVYDSPVYYLHQNDLVYVEPTNKRVRETTIYGNQIMNAGFWVGIPSLIISIIALTK